MNKDFRFFSEPGHAAWFSSSGHANIVHVDLNLICSFVHTMERHAIRYHAWKRCNLATRPEPLIHPMCFAVATSHADFNTSNGQMWSKGWHILHGQFRIEAHGGSTFATRVLTVSGSIFITGLHGMGNLTDPTMGISPSDELLLSSPSSLSLPCFWLSRNSSYVA